MGIKRTLGGDRLGTGKKMTVELENFGRSTFNLNKVIRFDQAFGVLQPAYCAINLNGGTFYIDVKAMAKTLPTNGPIMGRAKYQIDFFTIPIRLYIAALHNNALGVGLKMNQVYLPQFEVEGIPKIDFTSDVEPNKQQVAQDSLLAYIGIRGLGNPKSTNAKRKFPAIFMLGMYDIYRNYYVNKQEEIGVVVKGNPDPKGGPIKINNLTILPAEYTAEGSYDSGTNQYNVTMQNKIPMGKRVTFTFHFETPVDNTQYNVEVSGFNLKHLESTVKGTDGITIVYFNNQVETVDLTINVGASKKPNETSIQLETFELTNIDEMREAILAAPKNVPFNIGSVNLSPYNANGKAWTDGKPGCYHTMAGLPVKTYMSDRFNNWLSTEWIDGVNGINDITAVDVSNGKLTMNALILSKKLFNMMNRIAISGGSYVDWQEAVWGVRAASMAESPIYCGGMSFDIVFDEIVSNSPGVDSAGNDQPLGSLAGRGTDARPRGGKVKIKAAEPSMILAIASCTPYIDYSQGNKWWNRLETMDDFHKPDLDRIGFQELLTEEFAAADTTILENGDLKYNSVGKQTSWIEYQTDVNETFGDFSAGGPLEWMAFNRKYTYDATGKLEDATTYIDPTIYNVAFADASLSTKPLWMQIAFNIEGRRVMGAKQIPNL